MLWGRDETCRVDGSGWWSDTFMRWLPTRSMTRWSGRRKRAVMSFTHAGSVALNSRVCTAAGTLPAPKIFSTSSTKPMFSISSHSSSTRNLSSGSSMRG